MTTFSGDISKFLRPSVTAVPTVTGIPRFSCIAEIHSGTLDKAVTVGTVLSVFGTAFGNTRHNTLYSLPFSARRKPQQRWLFEGRVVTKVVTISDGGVVTAPPHVGCFEPVSDD